MLLYSIHSFNKKIYFQVKPYIWSLVQHTCEQMCCGRLGGGKVHDLLLSLCLNSLEYFGGSSDSILKTGYL